MWTRNKKNILCKISGFAVWTKKMTEKIQITHIRITPGRTNLQTSNLSAAVLLSEAFRNIKTCCVPALSDNQSSNTGRINACFTHDEPSSHISISSKCSVSLS